MKLFKTKLRMSALALGAIMAATAGASAQTTLIDDAYSANDILMFFQNPQGTALTGNDKVVAYSLGNSQSVFRAAATPGDTLFNQTISLGNINSTLTSAFGSDWTSLASTSTIFSGAVGQAGSVISTNTGTTNGDYARTVYVTKPRNGAGTLGSSNSASVLLPSGTTSQANVASAIRDSNNAATTQPIILTTATTVIDDQNPFTPLNNPATAYSAITGGVQGALSSTTFSLGTVNNIVLALDLYRATPVLNASGWQNINGIDVAAREGYYLGTITLSSNGDLNFVAVPEPSTYALLALAGGVILFVARRRQIKQS